MCRYALTSYKPHLACFTCRKQFKRRLARDIEHQGEQVAARCPQCRGPMADMGLDFKPPPQDDERGWAVAASLWEVGETFHSCGCGGPGYRPRDPVALRAYLDGTRTRYLEHLRRWMDSPPHRDRESAMLTWRRAVARIDVALGQHG